jgi:hypothetical protein
MVERPKVDPTPRPTPPMINGPYLSWLIGTWGYGERRGSPRANSRGRREAAQVRRFDDHLVLVIRSTSPESRKERRH